MYIPRNVVIDNKYEQGITLVKYVFNEVEDVVRAVNAILELVELSSKYFMHGSLLCKNVDNKFVKLFKIFIDTNSIEINFVTTCIDIDEDDVKFFEKLRNTLKRYADKIEIDLHSLLKLCLYIKT